MKMNGMMPSTVTLDYMSKHTLITQWTPLHQEQMKQTLQMMDSN